MISVNGINRFNISWAINTSGSNTFAIDTSTKRMASIFRVPKTGTITDIYTNTSSVTGGPSYDIRLESTTAGSVPIVPSGSLASANTFVTVFPIPGGEWNALSSNYSATKNEVLALVIAPNTINPTNFATFRKINKSDITPLAPYALESTNSGSTWSLGTPGRPALAARYNDGSIVSGAVPFINIDFSSDISNVTTPTEIGIKWTPEIDQSINGFMMSIQPQNASSDYDVILYDSSNNILASASFAGDYASSISDMRFLWGSFDSEIRIQKGSSYRLVVKPTTSNAIKVLEASFFEENDKNTVFGDGVRTFRTGAGAWTDSSTSVIALTPVISEINAENIIINSGMSGNMQG